MYVCDENAFGRKHTQVVFTLIPFESPHRYEGEEMYAPAPLQNPGPDEADGAVEYPLLKLLLP